MQEYRVEQENLQMSEYRIEFFLSEKTRSGKIAFSHIHPAVEILYITAGRFRIGVDETFFDAEAGDMVLFRSNVIHTTELIDGTPGIYYVLKVHPSLIFEMFAGKHHTCALPFLQNRTGAISHIRANEFPQEVLAVWTQMIEEWKRGGDLLYIAQRIHAAELLLALLRTTLHPQAEQTVGEDVNERTVRQIYESVRYIDENYASDITPGECAAAIHMSYSYFAKLFRAVTGKTFKEYLTSVRLSRAENILLTTDLSITEVAACCGYSNLSYFIAEYKRVKGKTPREARK